MSNQMIIEKGIPIPDRRRDGGITGTLRKMSVGDSFLIPAEMNRASAHIAATKLGITITTRKQSDGTVRVWRTEDKQ